MLLRYDFTDKSEGYMKRFLLRDHFLGDGKDIIGIVYEIEIAERITRLLNEDDIH